MTKHRTSSALLSSISAIWLLMMLAWPGNAVASHSVNERVDVAVQWTQDAKVTPCRKLKAPAPDRKKCNRSVSSSPANGRTRTDSDQLFVAPQLLLEAVSVDWPSSQAVRPHRRLLLYASKRARAYFWTVFAVSARLRN